MPQRWVGSGRTLFNNKAKPVKRYEPFFSSTHLYEPEADLAETGVSPILFYDPVLRVVATVHPDHTYEKVTFDPWSQTTYDVNDTVAPLGTETGDPRTDPDIAGYVEGYFETEPGWATWYAERSGGPAGPEADAATQAAAHANTPTVAHLDALGRSFMTVAHNRYDRAGATVEEKTATRTQLDVEGNELEVRDERTTAAGALEQRVVMRYAYDLVRTRVRQSSMEAGERWDLNDVGRQADSLVGQPPLSPPFHVRRAAPAHRALRHGQRRHGATGSAHGVRRGSGRRGEPLRPRVPGVRCRGTRDQRRLRLQGQPPRVPARPGSGVDPADELAAQSHCERRQLHDPDDLRRAQPRGHSTTPDGSVYEPTFNEANLLDRVDVRLRGAGAATSFVTNVQYNARGQRTLIAYANGAKTTYEYDPLTFRLTTLKTTRAGPDATAALLFQAATVVQDLRYTYDPVGNVTRIEDAALRTVFYGGQQVGPAGDSRTTRSTG